MKYENLTLGLMILSGLILAFASEGKVIRFTNYFSLFLIAVLGFIAPLFAFVFAIPIFMIVYINNQTGIKNLWGRLNKLSLQ